jgi:hypothetical protein
MDPAFRAFIALQHSVVFPSYSQYTRGGFAIGLCSKRTLLPVL